MSVLTFIALAAIVVVEEDGSTRSEATISVPRARAVVIDGTLEEAEWRGSAVVRRREGEVLLRHDGKYLYIGVRRPGAASRACASLAATPFGSPTRRSPLARSCTPGTARPGSSGLLSRGKRPRAR
jgi:hypothetical protein